METAIYRYRREAYIRVSPDLEIDKEYERMIVHELLHLIIDPLNEKYEQLFEMLEISVGSVHYPFDKHYTTEMERTVEHLSHVLYDK